MNAFKVKTEIHPRSDCRTYHTTAQLTELSGELSIEYAPAQCSGVCGLISGLPGVEQCVIGRYSATVVKGQAWEWADVEPAILQVLGAFRLPTEAMES